MKNTQVFHRVFVQFGEEEKHGGQKQAGYVRIGVMPSFAASAHHNVSESG